MLVNDIAACPPPVSTDQTRSRAQDQAGICQPGVHNAPHRETGGRNDKGRPLGGPDISSRLRSTLTGFVALLRLVDHIDAALAAHDLAIAMTRLERAERIRNLHRSSPIRGAQRLEICYTLQRVAKMVGGTGIEPVATTMSTWCSTAELTAQPRLGPPGPSPEQGA